MRDWRRLHGVKQTDFSRLSPFSEDEFLRFKKHPTNLYGCSPEECLEVFPGKSLFSIVSQLRIWRRKLGLKCPPELFGAKNFKEEDLQKIRDHPTLFSGEFLEAAREGVG